jgi:cellulose synthase/poly-beta-1,6-N-acetylglucosamine synthase-like glycosyltransferase
LIRVTPGTKLSKIRRLADLITTDLICICDPDLTVVDGTCRAVLERAAEEVHTRHEVVAFGIVEGRDNGTLLSRVIAVDKWLSHRMLRRCLWSLGVGITLPGQFLIVSPGLLRSLDPRVDSYLDDLYLGLVARRHGVRVHRVPVVVGQEDSRTNWGTLLAQRLRWMRGLAFLVIGHLRSCNPDVGLLLAHYFAYHGLPILGMFGVVLLGCVSPIGGVAVFVGVAFLLAVLSGQPLLPTVLYLFIFPVVHIIATLLWWMPASRSFLTRR